MSAHDRATPPGEPSEAQRLEALREINALLDLALQLQLDGRADEAREVYERGRETARRAADRLGECRLLRALADLEESLGRRTVAAKLRAQIRELYREGASTALKRVVDALDDPEAEARTLYEVAEVERAAGFSERAVATYRLVLSRYEASGDVPGQMGVLLSLADLCVEQGDRSEAQKILARVRSVAHKEGDARTEADAIFRLARLEGAGDFHAATKLLEQAAALYDEADRVESEGRLRLTDPPLPEAVDDTRAFDSRVMARVARREKERLERAAMPEPEPEPQGPPRRDWRRPVLDAARALGLWLAIAILILALRWLVRLAPGVVPPSRVVDAVVALLLGALTVPAGRVAGVQSAALRWIGGGVVLVATFLLMPLVQQAPAPDELFSSREAEEEEASAPSPLPTARSTAPERLERVASRRQQLRDAADAHRAAGEHALAARTLLDLARLESAEGRPLEARAALLEAAEEALRGNDVAARAEALARLGELEAEAGEVEQALARYEAALQLHEQAGDEAGLARTLVRRAALERARGSTEEARRMLERAMETYTRLGDDGGRARVLLELAALSAPSDPARALVEYRSALDLFRRTGDLHGQAEVQAGIAGLHAAAGRLDEALEAARSAASLADQADLPVLSARLWAEVARLQRRAGKQAEALQSWETALARLAGARGSRLQATVLSEMAELKAALADVAGAREAYLSALGIWQKVGDEAAQTQVIQALARLMGQPTPGGGGGGGSAPPR